MDLAIPVRHQGELLGAFTIRKRDEALTPADSKLITDLAAQAGLVLRNARLTADLLARLEDLRHSRQRLVRAQDEARRRLERNIHDGAQQLLVALKVRLSLAERLIDRDPAKLKRALSELKDDTDEALQSLRELARGIYPPLLAEALQNVAKSSEATVATIRLSADNGRLAFAIKDDGKGFDPSRARQGSGLQNMRDRIEALGGTIAIRTAPGEGTEISGTVPVEPVSVRRAEQAPHIALQPDAH